MRRKPVQWIERYPTSVKTDRNHEELLTKVGFTDYIRWELYRLTDAEAEIFGMANAETYPMLLEGLKMSKERLLEVIQHLRQLFGLEIIIKHSFEELFAKRMALLGKVEKLEDFYANTK